jgi:sugar lactone lactonase YvrE
MLLCGLLIAGGAARAQAVQTVLGDVFSLPVGVALDGAGNIYVASDRANTIVKVTPAGAASVFVDATAGLDFPEGLAFDGNGNLFVANSGNGSISMVTPAGVVSSFVASGLGQPMGLAIDSLGNLYAADNQDNQIFQINPMGMPVTPVVFADDPDFLNSPIGLTFDAQGNLLVANFLPTHAGGGITKITPAGALSTFIGFNMNGLLFPSFMVFDSLGNLFVTDALGVIFEVSPKGVVTSFDATAFVSPRGLAIDRFNDLFVDDIDAATLVELTPKDVATLIAGNALAEPSFTALDSAGNLYVSNPGSRNVTKVTPGGVASVFVPRSAGVKSPSGLAFDAKGTLFLADAETESIVQVASDGTVTPFVDLSADANVPQAMVFDANGNLFVACSGSNAVLKVTPAGKVTAVISQADGLVTPEGLVFDTKGNLFVADAGFDTIIKLTPAGQLSTVVPVSAGLSAPQGIAFDGNGTLYIANSPGGRLPPGIVAVSPSGIVSLFEENVPGLGNPIGLSFMPGDTLFAVDFASNSLFQIGTPPPGQSLPAPLLASVLPGGRSVVAATPATVFATILNTGTTALFGCGVTLAPTAPAALSLSFQATNPATNQPVGPVNQTQTILGNGTQGFVLTFNSAMPLVADQQALVFSCDDVQPAPVIPGVNTVDLTFSGTPIADIIALAATAPMPGVVTVPLSQQAAGAFAVASINVGSAQVLNVTTDTGSTTLPVTVQLCQTEPLTGQCQGMPDTKVPVSFQPGSTPTFSIFITATSSISFAPANSRIFVRFLDNAGNSHGSTSVAVQTQ